MMPGVWVGYWPPVCAGGQGRSFVQLWGPVVGTGEVPGGHSLLCDHVVLGEGCALHPGNLHPVGDLGEIQAQVDAADGHPRPSFWGARHGQDLEGNKRQES